MKPVRFKLDLIDESAFIFATIIFRNLTGFKECIITNADLGSI
jgi:hypothetical protein